MAAIASTADMDRPGRFPIGPYLTSSYRMSLLPPRTDIQQLLRRPTWCQQPPPSAEGGMSCSGAHGDVKLLRRLGHCRGMMVDNEPVFAFLYVSKAVARREYLGFSVLDVGEGIIAGIDGRAAVHAG
jgi:hypothetical protein